MSKTVTFIDDVYPYCVGDVIVLNDEELKAVDQVAKSRKRKVYETGAQPEVDDSTEADRQAENRRASRGKSAKEAAAEQTLTTEATAKAEADGKTSPAGTTTPGTAGGDTVKTAEAKS